MTPVAASTRTLRDRILDAAEARVLTHGFAATTVDGVLADAGASKGAFFHHFPTKAHLGRALVERYAERDAALLDEFAARAEAVSAEPADRLVGLVALFEAAADDIVALQPSCLFVSFIYESELADPSTMDAVTASIRHWRARLLAMLEAAVATRPSFPPVDLPSLADHVFTTFEGAFLLGRALDDPSHLRRQLAHLRHYLELLFGLPVSPTRHPIAGDPS